MLYLPITRTWMLSRPAQRIYFASALLAVGFLATVWVLRAEPVTINPSSTQALLRFLLFPCLLGTAALWVAMWYFWFGFDTSHWAVKAIWFVLLSIVGPLSAILYYFIVYRRRLRPLLKAELTEQANAATSSN